MYTYGEPGETVYPENFLTKQRKAAIERIDEDLRELRETDPSMYYEAEWNALLDRRLRLSVLVSSGVQY